MELYTKYLLETREKKKKAFSDMAEYKLTYFPVRAKAESVRLALAFAGVNFEDVRVNQELWQPIKASGKPPFGQLPILEFDNGKVLSQSKAMLRFVGRRFGMTPKKDCDDYDFLVGQADMLVDQMNDMETKMGQFHYGDDEEKKAIFRKKFYEEVLPQLCGHLEGLLKGNPKGKDFFVGDKLTYADIAVFAFFNGYVGGGKEEIPPEISGFPVLSAWYKGVLNLPNILKWIQTRPANANNYPY